jgi:hypothetical protein
MKQRPLIKWKSFWLGILVLGFLGWAWAFSMGRSSGVKWLQGARASSLAQLDGTAGVSSVAFSASHWKGEWIVWNETEVISDIPRVPPAFHLEEAGIHVAHWFLILLFLVPWVGFLAWRVRRQRKQTETNA